MKYEKSFIEKIRKSDDPALELSHFLIESFKNSLPHEKISFQEDFIEKLRERLEEVKKRFSPFDETMEFLYRGESIFRSLNRENGFFTEPYLRSLRDKAKEKIKSYIINPLDFSDIYPLEEIQEDLRKTQELEKEWELDENITKIFTETIELISADYFSEWLNVHNDSQYYVDVLPTSKPDDYGITNEYRKGFDFSLEFIRYDENRDIQGVEYAGATLDITTSEKPEVIDKKVSSIIRIIKDSDKTLGIKYFESDETGKRGFIEVVPFLFVISHETARDILAKFYKKDSEGLRKHHVQLALIRQLKYQNAIFLALSKQYGKESFVKRYTDIQEYLNYLDYKKQGELGIDLDLEELSDHYRGIGLLVDSLRRVIRDKDFKENTT